MSIVSWDTLAVVYDRFMGRWTHVFLPALMKAADLAPGHRVLDIATGTGESALRLADVVGRAGSVLGADVSLSMLARAGGKAAGRGVRLMATDGQAIACRDATFDRVVCQLGLMFFPDPVAGVREARRVLRPGGRFAALVWSAPARVPWFSLLAAELLEHFPERRDELFLTGRLGDPARLADVLRDGGLDDVRVTPETQSMEFASFDDYWSHVEGGAIRIGQMLRDVPPAEAQGIRARLRSAMRRFTVEDRLVMPSEVLVATGARP